MNTFLGTGSLQVGFGSSNNFPVAEDASPRRERKRKSNHAQEIKDQTRSVSWHNSAQAGKESASRRRESSKSAEKERHSALKKCMDPKKLLERRTHGKSLQFKGPKLMNRDHFDEEKYIGTPPSEYNKRSVMSVGRLKSGIFSKDPNRKSEFMEDKKGISPKGHRAMVKMDILKEKSTARRIINLPLVALALIIEMHLVWWLIQLLVLVWMTTRVDWQLRVRSPVASWPEYTPSRMPWMPGQLQMRNRLYAVWISLAVFYLPMVIMHMNKYMDYISPP